MAKQDEYVKTALRLPPGLHTSLSQAAAERGHSLNAEMVRRLDDSFSERMSDDRQIEVDALLKALRDTITELARNSYEREEALKEFGGDLKACTDALPLADEEMVRKALKMLGDAGVSLQADDTTDARARVRTLYYLITDTVLRSAGAKIKR
ncbi:Arc family DNA-binding protein [Paraburkholderia graminis]|uniref:Arc family DNA-binding protein n=1 Tax=Paraburkholderia graminis TaxID=60548 RepID=UPI0038BA65E6